MIEVLPKTDGLANNSFDDLGLHILKTYDHITYTDML